MGSNDALKAWSLISPLPVIAYVEAADQYIVYINGIVTTYATAMHLMLEPYGIRPSPEVKRNLQHNMANIYATGIFGDVQWDDVIYNTDYVGYIRSVLRDYIKKITHDMHINDVMKLLDTNLAKTLSNS